MKTIAIVVRKLKDGKTYEDFRKAWYHTKGFGVPTKMYSVINAINPREIITIGIMETDIEKMPSLLKIDAEQRKSNSLYDIIEESIIRYFGVLVAEDDFSAPGLLEYQPPKVDGIQIDLKELPDVLAEIVNMTIKKES